MAPPRRSQQEPEVLFSAPAGHQLGERIVRRRRSTPTPTPRQGYEPIYRPRLAALDPSCHTMLAALDNPTLLLALGQPNVTFALRNWAEEQGLNVVVARDLKSCAQVLTRSPSLVAVIADERLDGDHLLEGTLHRHFLHHRVPYHTIDARALAQTMVDHSSTLRPVIRWLQEVLAPLVEVWRAARGGSTVGETMVRLSVGVPQLLRVLAAGRATAEVRLRGPRRQARLQLVDGHLVGLVVEAPRRTVGGLAMLHLIGCDWFQWGMTSLDRRAVGSVPVGELEQMLQDAHLHNNAWLERLYAEGLDQRWVTLDPTALKQLLDAMPPAKQPLARQLAGGLPAVELAQISSAGVELRRLLYLMRRAGVLCPRSPAARAITGEAARLVATDELPQVAADPHVTDDPLPGRRSPRALVPRLVLVLASALAVLAVVGTAWILTRGG